MRTNLLREIKELLALVESFKSEISRISLRKEGFKAVNRHIDAAISESEEATKKIIDLIGISMETLQEILSLIQEFPDGERKERVVNLLSGTLENLINALTFLEFQDIMAQRLLKVKGFLSDVEKGVLKIALLAGIEEVEDEKKEDLQKRLKELEWKKEISQEEVDEIMKQFGI